MALYHSRLGLENKSGRIFCVWQVYFTKHCQHLGTCNPTFYTFIHHIWGETVPWGAVFIIQTSDRMQYFTILQYKLHSFNIQDDRSTRGLLPKPLKKFPKSPIRLAGSQFWQALNTFLDNLVITHSPKENTQENCLPCVPPISLNDGRWVFSFCQCLSKGTFYNGILKMCQANLLSRWKLLTTLDSYICKLNCLLFSSVLLAIYFMKFNS